MVAKAICRSYSSMAGCFCRGGERRCHAMFLYAHDAVAAVKGLAVAGMIR